MCGRFTLTSTPEELARRFGLADPPLCSPRYNVAPGQEVLAVRAAREGARRATALRWGLVPRWADGPGVGARMINARAETAPELPAFRDAFRARRCIVPASGFYEWAERGGGFRQPYWIGPVDGEAFGIAGLWERWRSPEGESLETCTLLTTAANARVAELHDRMPAILVPRAYAAWLDPGPADIARLSALLRPLAADALGFHPVGTRVNRVDLDDPACVEAVAEPPRQTSLF